MLKSLLFVSIVLISYIDGAADVLSSFAQDELVPDILDAAPTTLLGIRFNDDLDVMLGGELTIEQAADEPKLVWPADSEQLYTIIKVDPDAPSRREPSKRSWLHWLVVDVPGDRIADGRTLAAYRGAGAPPKTGLHRYAFLVFKQDGRLDDVKNIDNSNRANFDLRAFMKQHSLDRPLAGNYYQAKNAQQQ